LLPDICYGTIRQQQQQQQHTQGAGTLASAHDSSSSVHSTLNVSHAWLNHLALLSLVLHQASKAGELLRPSLPSVLRTSADLGAGLNKQPAATGQSMYPAPL
jgi:hypothetical protein